jgi:hypothetical protein
MVFQNKGLTYYMTIERMGIMTLRFSMGYVDVRNEIYELTFDI